MNQGKIVAIITGAISIFLAVAYLIIVQLLDFRGEMIPAPTFDDESLSINIPLENKINNCNIFDINARII